MRGLLRDVCTIVTFLFLLRYHIEYCDMQIFALLPWGAIRRVLFCLH